MGDAPGAVRRIEADEDEGLRSFVDVVNAVTPEWPMSLEEVAWSDALYPGGARFLASLDGTTVGAASVGRIYSYEPAFERFWFGVHVLPESRRRGLGGSLWQACSAVAREQGKTGLQTDLSERQADGLAFLEHRGFEVKERSKMVQLDLRGLATPDVAPPDGIVITSLADRPDLEGPIHAVAVEAYADIPSIDEPVIAGPIDEFLARDVRRDGIPADALAIALDAGTGEVAGWASLMYLPSSTTMAWHDMTAVGRRWRGRGVATALKRATIAWAIEHGLEILETGNDEGNAPMRAVNARLGYRPIPDMLTLRGPLAPD
jgi:GNAT superfamily N-acetyltransferase